MIQTQTKTKDGIYILPERFHYLNNKEPFSWDEVLRDFIFNKVQRETKKKVTTYYTYASEGIIYYWDYDKSILLRLTDFGNRIPTSISMKSLSEQAFFKVKELY